MTEAEQIEAAKAALDKATPGPWEVFFTGTIGKYVVEISEKSVHKRIATTTQPNATLIAAAPALVRRVQELEDWQAKALPYLRRERDHFTNITNLYPESPTAINGNIDIADLTALIEQAEGGK